jgi:hypothetical protein
MHLHNFKLILFSLIPLGSSGEHSIPPKQMGSGNSGGISFQPHNLGNYHGLQSPMKNEPEQVHQQQVHQPLLSSSGGPQGGPGSFGSISAAAAAAAAMFGANVAQPSHPTDVGHPLGAADLRLVSSEHFYLSHATFPLGFTSRSLPTSSCCVQQIFGFLVTIQKINNNK